MSEAGAWVTLMGNDIIVKRKSESEDTKGLGAEMGAVVSFNAKGFFLEGEVGPDGMMSTSLKRKGDGATPFEEIENQKVQIGEGDTIMGLELSLRHANQGSMFRVRMSSKYAFGDDGRKEVQDRYPAPAVPPAQNLEYEVIVLDVQHLDAFMSGCDATFEDIHLRKECGNRWFYCGYFDRAARAYAKGASKGDAYFQMNPSEQEMDNSQKQILDDYISCLNNLSACYISNGDYYKAKEICVKVLGLEDTNIKALLRAARSSLALFSFEECEACIARVLELEPENKLALQERVKLIKTKKDYKGKKLDMDRKMTRSMFGQRKGDAESRNGKTFLTPPISSDDSSAIEKGNVVGEQAQRNRRLPSPSSCSSSSSRLSSKEEGGDEAKTTTMNVGAQGYGESSNLILLLITAIAVLLISVWLATNSKIDVNEPIIPTPTFRRKGDT